MQKQLSQSKLVAFFSKKGVFFYLKNGENLTDSSACGRMFDTLTLPEDFEQDKLQPVRIKIDSSAVLLKSPNLTL